MKLTTGVPGIPLAILRPDVSGVSPAARGGALLPGRSPEPGRGREASPGVQGAS